MQKEEGNGKMVLKLVCDFLEPAIQNLKKKLRWHSTTNPTTETVSLLSPSSQTENVRISTRHRRATNTTSCALGKITAADFSHSEEEIHDHILKDRVPLQSRNLSAVEKSITVRGLPISNAAKL